MPRLRQACGGQVRLPHRRSSFLFLYFFIVLFSFFPLTLSPALAITLPTSSPAGQSIILAQTESGTTGACSQGQGRAFLLNWASPWTTQGRTEVTLSGLALFVVARKDKGALDLSHFRLALRQGLMPAVPAAAPLIFADLAPSQSLFLEEDNWNALYEVFFAFPQALTLKKPTSVAELEASYQTFYLACRNLFTGQPHRYQLRESGPGYYRVGLSRLYDEATQTNGANLSLAPSLLLFAPATSASSPAPTPSGTPPQFHPLVLLHGLGGKPEDWREGTTNYQTYLRALGYPDDSVHYYSYGIKDGVYNYQGDIRELALGLEEVVNTLSTRHQAAGGDGRVDLLGYSLGGVVARQYLTSHRNSHKIRKLITIGSPHKGSWVLGVDQNLYSFPVIGKTAEKTLADFILMNVNKNKSQKLDKDSVAVKQIYPGAEFLEGYSGINRNVPQDVEYHAFYGDIHASVQRKLFHWTVASKIGIGDGLILPESATGIPTVSVRKFPYSEDVTLSLKLEKLGNSYAFNLDLPSLDSWNASHMNLLDRLDLRKDLSCLILDSGLCHE